MWSSIWRGIMSMSQVIKSSVTWSIGDGRLMKFWTDEWLEGVGPLVNHVASPSQIQNLDLSVKEAFDDLLNVGESLCFCLSGSILTQIRAAPSPLPFPDKLIWKHTATDKFTLASAVDVLMNPDSCVDMEPMEELWRHSWKWDGPQRIRTLMWTTANGKLLMNTQRQRRHLTYSVVCTRCNDQPETVLHALRDYKISTSWWRKIIPIKLRRSFFSTDLRQWIRSNLKAAHLKSKGTNWPILFGVMMSKICMHVIALYLRV